MHPLPGSPREDAIPALVEAEGGRLYSLGLRFCGNADEAADLVQETFLQAWRHWDAFEGRSQPSTWLYTIAARVCQRFHKKRSGEPERLESFDELASFSDGPMGVVPSDEDDPLAARLRAEARERVERAIAELPPDFRMPLVLKEIVGFSVRDVSEILGVKEATLKTRLFRARLRVRRALEEGLPRREVPPPIYARQVCLDLLSAKLEALDRGVDVEFPGGVVCERCAELFATLDFTQDVCQSLAAGALPPAVRAEIERALAADRGDPRTQT